MLMPIGKNIMTLETKTCESFDEASRGEIIKGQMVFRIFKIGSRI